MKFDSKEFKELCVRYPFLKDIKKDFPSACKEVNFSLNVKPATGDTLFLIADNVGCGETDSCLLDFEKDALGRRLEMAFALDARNEVLNTLRWPNDLEAHRRASRRRSNQGKAEAIHCQHVLWANKMDEGWYSEPIYDKTFAIAWLSCTSWFEDKCKKAKTDAEKEAFNGSYKSRFGEAKSCDISITVYEAPEEGFDKLKDKANVYENLYLTSKILTEAVFDKDWDITSISGALWELSQGFAEDVFFGGGMSDYLESINSNASGKIGDIKVMAAGSCGYTRVQLEGKVDGEYVWASIQVRPDSKNMYVLGCGGTLPRLRKLIRQACKNWPAYKSEFKADEKVSIC